MGTVWILIFIILVIIVIVYIKYQNSDVTYVKSDIDNQEYLVRDLDDKQQAANMLANIKAHIYKITDHLYQNKDTKYVNYKSYIEQLNDRIKNVVVLESTEDSVYTSYSINKGEQIVFCLRSRKVKNQMHKFNLLMYVVLHEMSHVACPEYGHTPLFKQIFAFITAVAIEQKLYERIDFTNNPTEYCGMTVTDSII